MFILSRSVKKLTLLRENSDKFSQMTKVSLIKLEEKNCINENDSSCLKSLISNNKFNYARSFQT